MLGRIARASVRNPDPDDVHPPLALTPLELGRYRWPKQGALRHPPVEPCRSRDQPPQIPSRYLDLFSWEASSEPGSPRSITSSSISLRATRLSISCPAPQTSLPAIGEAEKKFRCVRGFRSMPQLISALEASRVALAGPDHSAPG